VKYRFAQTGNGERIDGELQKSLSMRIVIAFTAVARIIKSRIVLAESFIALQHRA